MYRMVTASLFLVASTAFCSAQELIPSEWKSQHGAFLKALYGSPASFTGVFITGPGGHVRRYPWTWLDKLEVYGSHSKPRGRGRTAD